MPDRVPPEQYPWWVKFSMIGARSRASQWIWLWSSFIAGLVLFVLAFTNLGGIDIFLAVVGVWAFVATLLYGMTIRWIDRHGTWS